MSSSKNTKLSFISFVGLLKEASNRIYSIISKIWKTKWLKKDWPYNFLLEMSLSRTNLGNSFLASPHRNYIEIRNVDININKNNWIIQWSQLSISSTVSNILYSSYFVNKVKQIIVHNHLTHTHTVVQTWNVDVRVQMIWELHPSSQIQKVSSTVTNYFPN